MSEPSPWVPAGSGQNGAVTGPADSPADTPITVVVADDQAVVRDGLCLLLSVSDDIEVVGQATNGREAVELAAELHPDVALMDLRMPELDGAQATAQIISSGNGTRVLILTTFADDDAVLPALRSGASGYLTKDAPSESLLSAIRQVASGQMVLDPAVQQRLVEMVTGNAAANKSPASSGTPSAGTTGVVVAQGVVGTQTAAGAPGTPPGSATPAGSGPQPAPAERSDPTEPADTGGLTRREVDVVRLVAQGLNNRQVARAMVVSEATVKTHINHILAKLAMEDRAGLIAWAWRQGLAGD